MEACDECQLDGMTVEKIGGEISIKEEGQSQFSFAHSEDAFFPKIT